MLLPLLKSDLYEVIIDTMNGKLASNAPLWHMDSSAVTVVMASAGYPGSYKKGVEITGSTARVEEKRPKHAGAKHLFSVICRLFCWLILEHLLYNNISTKVNPKMVSSR